MERPSTFRWLSPRPKPRGDGGIDLESANERPAYGLDRTIRVSRAAAALMLLPPLHLEGQQPPPAVQMVGDTGEGAKYWARWRGPSGQGVVSGTGYPDSWSGTESEVEGPVPGNGNSSPIVWGDRIFLTTGYDSGRRLSVVALRRSDGMKLWKRSRLKAARHTATIRTATRQRRRQPMVSGSTSRSAHEVCWRWT